MPEADQYTAFLGDMRIASGDLATVTAVARAAIGAPGTPIVILSDTSGRTMDFDYRGSPQDSNNAAGQVAPSRPARGRPKLGVTAREVTLLPRHWEWLGAQPGGASAALRRLVDQARRDNFDASRKREAREAAHRAMTTLGGDLAGYEEALRALYAGDRSAFVAEISAWPPAIRDYIGQMAAASWTNSMSS